MGLMDKFKNLFTDEEIIEEDDVDTVEIKEVKKEEEVNKLPTFMREKIEKEEKDLMLKPKKLELDNDDFLVSNNEKEIDMSNIESKSTFKFPIDFSEEDFIETRSRQTIHKPVQEIEQKVETEKRVIERENKPKPETKVADLYKDKKIEKKCDKPKFKATPIISPIYGILDKNYTPGDIENSSGINYEENRPSKSVDFDSVRKKAYGSLSKEIKENLMCENCEYLKEAKECRKAKEKVVPDYSYELLQENSHTKYKDITLDEATENYYDYGVAYEKKLNVKQEEVKISNFTEERPIKEIPPVKSSINLLSTLKKSMGDNKEIEVKKEENLELTDDLFNLIDSMYDERNEN